MNKVSVDHRKLPHWRRTQNSLTGLMKLVLNLECCCFEYVKQTQIRPCFFYMIFAEFSCQSDTLQPYHIELGPYPEQEEAPEQVP